MKKIISAVLSVIMLIGAVSLGLYASAEGSDLCFAVASDLHYNVPSEELETNIPDDPIFWYANRRCAMEDESGFIIDEFLNQCAENDDIKYVLISGDLADNGKTKIEEHEAVAAKLRAFEEKTGKDVFVINGNHDASLNEGDTQFADFKRIYADFGYDKALEALRDDCSYTANLGEKYRLIALDSCSESQSTEDGMTKEKIEWVHTQADKAYADGRYPILMMHHNLLDHMPLQRILSHDFIIRNHLATAEKFADWGIKVVLTGHEHCGDAASFTSALGNVITDYATTSLTMYPLAYRVFSFTEEEIKYESKSIESIDCDALADTVAGYTDEQLSLMKADLTTYSKEFLKAGIKLRLGKGLRMEEIGVEESSPFYGLVYTAVTGLTDILEMPLYGENSVQQLAKTYNIDIPDSSYKTGWDLAGELVAAHYAGSEKFDLDSTEVLILLRTVDLILLDDLSSVNDEVFFKAANYVFTLFGTDGIAKELTRLGTDTFGPVTAGEYFLLAIASPLLYKFACDSDNVDDNNGTIAGYGTVNTAQKVQNVFANISNIISVIVKYCSIIFGYLSRILSIGK